MDNINHHENDGINNINNDGKSNTDAYYCYECKNTFSFDLASKFYGNVQNIECDENNCSLCILSGEYACDKSNFCDQLWFWKS